MKKTILTFLVLIATANSMWAQSKNLYDVVYEEAMKVVNNPKSSDDQIQINQFKVTALNYMTMMLQKRGMKKDDMFFATQAVMMSSFVTDYHANVLKAQEISPAKRNEILKIYSDACKYNPMFKDTNKERANAFVNEKGSLTPFCLDTDWEKAYDQATTLAKAALK